MLRLIQLSLCSLFIVLVGCIPFPEHSCRYFGFQHICIPTRAPIDEGDLDEFFADPALNRETVILRLGEPDVLYQNGTAFLYYWRRHAAWAGYPPIIAPLDRRHALLFVFNSQGLLERLEKEEWYDTSWKETEDWVQSVLPIPTQSDS